MVSIPDSSTLRLSAFEADDRRRGNNRLSVVDDLIGQAAIGALRVTFHKSDGLKFTCLRDDKEFVSALTAKGYVLHHVYEGDDKNVVAIVVLW